MPKAHVRLNVAAAAAAGLVIIGNRLKTFLSRCVFCLQTFSGCSDDAANECEEIPGEKSASAKA